MWQSGGISSQTDERQSDRSTIASSSQSNSTILASLEHSINGASAATMISTFSSGSTSDNSIAFQDARNSPSELFPPTSSSSYIESKHLLFKANQPSIDFEKVESTESQTLPFDKARLDQDSRSTIHSDDDDDRFVHSGDKQRTKSFRSHTSHTTSHDTHHSSTTRSGSPFDVQPPSSGTSSSTGAPSLSANSSLGKRRDSTSVYTGLARSSSTASTTPTSPEAELHGSILMAKEGSGSRLQESTSDTINVVQPQKSPAREAFVMDGAERIGLEHSISLDSISSPAQGTKQPDDRNIVLSPTMTVRESTSERLEARSMLKEEDLRLHDRSSTVNTNNPNRSSHDTIQSLGPSIGSLAHRNKPLPVPKDDTISVTIPALSVSTTDVEQAYARGSRDVSPSDMQTIEEDPSSQRSSFKSFLTKSGRLFRSSTYSKDGQLSPWTPDHSPGARVSETSLPSRNASPSSSAIHLAASMPGSRNNSQSNLHLPDPIERSSSPFLFGKNLLNKHNRNSEKSAGNQRFSLSSGNLSSQNVPISSPSISSNSDSSHAPQNERARMQGSQRRSSNRLSRHFGSFSVSSLAPNTSVQSSSPKGEVLENTNTTGQKSQSETVTAAIAEASKSLQRQRPKLLRTRSKSFDDLTKKLHPEAIKSLAVGTVSVFEAEQIKPKQSNSKAKDVPERPWSRLAGSLRRMPNASISTQRSTGESDDIASPEIKLNLPAELPPKVPPKDTVEISTDAWWESKPIVKKEISKNGAPLSYMQFEAAQLAGALSRGDEDVISRMENAIDSPKTSFKPLDSSEKKEEEVEKEKSTGADLVANQEEKGMKKSTTVSLIEPDIPREPPRSKSSLSTHRRSLSLGKVFEPLVSRSRSRNDTANYAFTDGKFYDSARADQQNVKRSSTISPPSSYRTNRLPPPLPNPESDPDLFLKQNERSILASKHRRSLSGSQSESPSNFPPRSSSISSIHKPSTSISSSHQPYENGMRPVRKNGHNRKPSLNVDTNLATSMAHELPKRPSSAMGMSAGLERESHARNVILARQPTLSIADDHEFLQALEQVRELNQVRIQRQREEKEKMQIQRKEPSFKSLNQTQYDSVPSGLVLRSISPVRQRSSSAGPCLEEANSPTSSCDLSPTSPVKTFSPAKGARPSPLELGVGKASGKLRDGAFINDEDWKKEVKALFVIREIVLTERSYAVHLEALLASIRQMDSIALPPPLPSTRSRMQPAALMMTSSIGVAARQNQNSPVPQHLVIMRNLLPQLITLSRTLANRIDENPTAAGVGAAFRLVGNQMEATFVAWNSAVKDIMDALRISEGPKGKARNRIGLITIQAQKGTEEDEKNDLSGFKSVPSSPTRSKSVVEKMFVQDPLTTSANTSTFIESPTQITFSEDVHNGFKAIEQQSTSTASKRRSTISSMTPSMAGAKAISFNEIAHSLSPSASRLDSKSSTPALPMNAKRRLSSSLANKTKNKTLSSSISSFEVGVAPTPPAHSNGSATHGTLKKLTPMDIAIMPTQRIPRYLLLLRDLHANTPPQSLSNARLQRSLDFIHRVAVDCDRVSKGGIPNRRS